MGNRSNCFLTTLVSLTVVSVASRSLAAKPEAPTEARPVIDQFSAELYRRLAAEPGNLFFSPYSICTALAMTSAGGVGPTADEITHTLALDSAPPKDPVEAARQIASLLDARGLLDDKGMSGVQLNSANALWCDQHVKFKKVFVDLLKNDFLAACEGVDFAKNPAGALKRINDWVATRTHDRIRDLLTPDAITAATKLILTNAIYFKGNWQHPFKKDFTRERPFTLDDGVRADVPTMMQSENFRYAKLDGFSALEMPYKGDRLNMLILLPDDPAGLPEFEKAFNPDRLRASLLALKLQKVAVALPRFHCETKYELSSALKDMGIKTAFSTTADFSGIRRDTDIFISKVIHKAFVDVDEVGTEAAAATGVVMEAKSARPHPIPLFTADHPFIYLIRDADHGAILFMGRVVDPRK